MRIVGLLSWFEETPSWLGASILSFATIGLDHLVALDGAYELYPDGFRRSGTEQHETITETVQACGIGCTIHTPERLWKGEREKRDFLFMLGGLVTGPDDWFVVLDSDEVVTDSSLNIPGTLGEAQEDVGETMLWERVEDDTVREVRSRKFFRAATGPIVGKTHYEYVSEDGRMLRGNENYTTLEPAIDLTGLRIEHRTLQRTPERRHKQQTYYRRAQLAGIEALPCVFCGEEAVVELPHKFRLTGKVLDFTTAYVCQDHVGRAVRDAETRIIGFGLPSDIRVLEDMRARARSFNEGS
jgi:hypothetical protein